MKVLIVFLIIFSTNINAFEYPNGALSAVSITADDGWTSQLKQAEILDDYGFKGTFYLSPMSLPYVDNNKLLWRDVYLRGHEIGNHSYYHYSVATLAEKTPYDIEKDTANAESWLYKNIYDNQYVDHTYAYPNGNYVIGKSDTKVHRNIGACSYASILAGVVSGARTTSNFINTPENISNRKFFVGGIHISGSDEIAINKAKKSIDQGIEKGSWTVLIFHNFNNSGSGIGISEYAYRKILDYILSKKGELYVDTFVKVKKYIQENTSKTNWICNI